MRKYSALILYTSAVDCTAAFMSLMATAMFHTFVITNCIAISSVESHEGSIVFVYLGPCSLIHEKFCYTALGDSMHLKRGYIQFIRSLFGGASFVKNRVSFVNANIRSESRAVDRRIVRAAARFVLLSTLVVPTRCLQQRARIRQPRPAHRTLPGGHHPCSDCNGMRTRKMVKVAKGG